MNPVVFDAALRARLATDLERRAPAPLEARALKRAAVCVIVTEGGGEAALLLTRRAPGAAGLGLAVGWANRPPCGGPRAHPTAPSASSSR
jgi:hypothetical protein